MRQLTILLGVAALAGGLLGCGGAAAPAAPTPADQVPVVAPNLQQQPAAAEEGPLNLAVEVPQQLRGDEPPPAPWPTFTPGPAPQARNRLLYVRSHQLYVAHADGSNSQPLPLTTKSPQLLALSYKDPGRAWLGPDGRYLLYYAGQEAQLWLADLQSMNNVALADRMIPVARESEGELIRTLTEQEMAWTADGARVALVGAPDTVDLFLVDAAAARLTRVTQDGLLESRPVWSPSGRYLAYLATDTVAGTQALMVLDASALQTVQIDMGPARQILGLDPAASFGFTGEFAWVSDGQLAFYPGTDRQVRSVGIWSYDVAGGSLRPVLTEPVADATWSGQARAWVFSRPDDPGQLWLLRLGDAAPTLLAGDGAYAPVWSPDGGSVLYSWSDPEGTGWDLRIVDMAGNSRTVAENVMLIQRETSEPGPAGKRFWTPSSDVVLYTAVGRDYGRAEQGEGYGGDAGPDLENWWAAPAGGDQPRQITDLQKTFYLQEPTLSPDGTTWVFMGFSYTDRVQHLYTMPRDGGHPKKVDAGVRWVVWLP